MAQYQTEFTTDGSVDATEADLLTLKAGDTEALSVIIGGFEDDDTDIEVHLYAKQDPTQDDDDADTVHLEADVSTPARFTGARQADFSFTATATTRLLIGRRFVVRVLLTRSGTDYTQTVMLGMIAATYPGNTVVAPSDEAYLRALGDANVEAAFRTPDLGGTGLATYAAGDMTYAATVNPTALSKLTIGAAGAFMRSSGTAPTWSTATMPATAAQGDILYGSATNVWSALTKGTANQVLTSNGTIPAWSSSLSITTLAVGGLTTLTRTTEMLRLAYDVSNYVSFAVSSAGGLTITPQTGQAVAVTTFSASGVSTLSGQTRHGDILRVDNVTTATTSGITGAGIDLYHETVAGGVIRAYNYTTVALVPLAIQALTLTLTAPTSVTGGLTTTNGSSVNDLTLSGSPTTVLQAKLGTTGVSSSLGTRQTAGTIFLAFNATQTTRSTDQWAQSDASSNSFTLGIGSSGLRVYNAIAGKSTDTFANFWTSAAPLLSMDTAGALTVASNLTSGGIVTGVRFASTATAAAALSLTNAAGRNAPYITNVNNFAGSGSSDDAAFAAYAQLIFYPNNGTTAALTIKTDLSVTVGGPLTTSAPTGGAGAWEFGIANAVTPTSPNRTLTVEIGGTAYYIAAKTTND